MPVSVTDSAICPSPDRRIASSTLPLSVNLNALDRRFLRTCSRRCTSVSIVRGTFRGDIDFKCQALFLRDGLEHLLNILGQPVERHVSRA